MKKIKKIFLFTIFGILSAMPVYAALPPLVPSCATGAEVPSLACALVLLGNISKLILGLSGSLALLFFIYGGFMLLTSRGNEQQISKGKEILSRALIGVIIIFGAYTAVAFLTKSVGFKESQFKLPEQELTEELKKESSQGQEQQQQQASGVCKCAMSAETSIPGPQGEVWEDSQLASLCSSLIQQTGLPATYDKNTNICTFTTLTDSAKCSTLNYDKNGIKVSCSIK